MIEVAIIMGSKSDWSIMKKAAIILNDFKISHEVKIISAHRTPDLMFEFAKEAERRKIKIIIAGAGGAAHLPGMVASICTIPVLGVPIPTKFLNGQDSLFSIVQMPQGIPVATFSIGEAGAVNAALFAVSILSNNSDKLKDSLNKFRDNQKELVLNTKLDGI